MSDEPAPSPENPSDSSPEVTPRVRRVSSPRPKKSAKAVPAGDESVFQSPVESPNPPKFPEFSEPSDETAPHGDWPEPEAASSGVSSPQENSKRKRRRKKGKGNAPQNASPQSEPDSSPPASAETSEPASLQAQPQRQHQPPRHKFDPELLAKFAWKIYLSEVSEEGVALVGDNDAKELSRRCFRLAEIFLEEQARRR